jgi:transposase
MAHATDAWKKAAIRPPRGDAHPEHTVEQYCLYIKIARAYGYTEAWVRRLINKCSTADGFKEMTGREPVAKTDAHPAA